LRVEKGRSMRGLINRFPEFLADAISIGERVGLAPASAKINNIVISGLGGSGIGGTIISQLIAHEAKVPVTVNKTYGIPEFVNENTLLIGCSYSGNTEETLDAIDAAKAKGAQIACITSGGKLAEWAVRNDWNCIVVPGGNPPRAMVAYALTELFFLMMHYQVISNNYISELKAASNLLNDQRESLEKQGKELANQLNGKRIVAYADQTFAGVAERFRQQVNENAKQLCWHHALPEMNHNELVGWAGGDKEIGVLIFRNDSDHDRTKLRMDLSKGIYLKYTPTVIEVNSKGSSNIERAYFHILLGDWISIHLAELNGIDPIEIKVIDYLKSELGKV
jgi:glucose/mannose-6-phosphate isomerase